MKFDLIDLEIFLDLSRSLSFSKTGERLRIDRALVTKRIKRLEDVLQVRLFDRTTRHVRLTDEGRILCAHAKQLIEGVDSIPDLFSKPQDPQGLVKLSAPVTVSHSILSKVLPRLQKKYPKIQIELLATNRMLNFIEEGLDLTIRATEPEDSAFVGRLLIQNQLIFAATPDYLRKHGVPKKISDLKNHSLLFIDLHLDLIFKKSGMSLNQLEANRQIKCSDGRFLIRLAEEGAGICIRPSWDLQSHFLQSSLVPIPLPDVLNDQTGLYLMYPRSKLLPTRTRVVIDEILNYFKT